MEEMNYQTTETQASIVEEQPTKTPKKSKAPMIIGIVAAVAVIAAVLVFLLTANARTTYDKALALIESGDYKEAYDLFEQLGDYKDAEKHLS